MKRIFISLLFLSVFGIANSAVPEKMQAVSSSDINSPKLSYEQGAIILSSNNIKLHEYDVEPVVSFTRVNAPYQVYKVNLRNNNSVGQHFKVLPAGIYHIDGFYMADEDLAFRSQNKFKFYFKVLPGKISYIGRVNISLKPGYNFKFFVTDFYDYDSKKFLLIHKGNFLVAKCLVVHSKTPSCELGEIL